MAFFLIIWHLFPNSLSLQSRQIPETTIYYHLSLSHSFACPQSNPTSLSINHSWLSPLQNNDNEEDVKLAKEVNPYQCEVVVWLVLIGIPLRWIRHIRKEFESADDLVILQRSSVTELKAELGWPKWPYPYPIPLYPIPLYPIYHSILSLLSYTILYHPIIRYYPIYYLTLSLSLSHPCPSLFWYIQCGHPTKTMAAIQILTGFWIRINPKNMSGMSLPNKTGFVSRNVGG